jgi:hypothetical protein
MLIKETNSEIMWNMYNSEKKYLELIIDDITFKMPIIIKDLLLKLACDSFNERKAREQDEYNIWANNVFYTDPRDASPNDEDVVRLAKICLNYLRHVHTPYEIIWGNIKRIIYWNSNSVYMYEYYNQLLKSKVNNIIMSAYPWIKAHEESIL